MRTSLGRITHRESLQVRHWIKKGLAAFEKFIEPHAGSFCLGNAPCAADCFLVPQFEAARRFDVSREAFPLLDKIASRCEALPEFKLARPERQPDYREL